MQIDQNKAQSPPILSTTESGTPLARPRHVKEKRRDVKPSIIMNPTNASTAMPARDESLPSTLQVNSATAQVFRTKERFKCASE
jgi:hypothetical protein